MIGNPKFTNQSPQFWANIKLISQKTGYSSKDLVIVPSVVKVKRAFTKLGLSHSQLFDNGKLTDLGNLIFEYFEYRAKLLNEEVKGLLMNAEESKELFERLRETYNPTCPLPFNKQKEEKSGHAYFTCSINTLIQQGINFESCSYDPREITSFTQNGFPFYSMSRRVDGAFPFEVNPIAIWEIKEYYYTTTFGSRIADGIYETMLDGYELNEVRKLTNLDPKHYLFTDAYYTWWVLGKSYLCRIVDILNMGLLTEWIVGREILTAIPRITNDWISSTQVNKVELF